MSATPGARTCPHCGAANLLDLGRKCVTCRKPLPTYCFSCYAAIADDKATTCVACGRRRWVVGDFVELVCASEGGSALRRHRYMTTLVKGGRVLHEWRCMKCLTDETRTDAFGHFPEVPATA